MLATEPTILRFWYSEVSNSCESKNLPVSSSKPILIIETLQCDRDDRPLCLELPPKTDGKKAEGTVQVPNVPHKTSVSDVSAPSV